MVATRVGECPSPEQLRKLIDGTVSTEDQSTLTDHLDSCEACQKTIEALAEGGSGVLSSVFDVERSRLDRSSAFWTALRQVEHEIVKVAHAPLGIRQSLDKGDLSSASNLDFLDPPEQPGTIGKLGSFHVIELIGRGGMGLVFRGFDVCLQRQVALKVLDPQYARNDLALNRFVREARAAGSIAHENVVAVYHVEKHHDALPVLVMRLVTGVSLQDRLDAKGGPLEIGDALQIGRQIAAGLAAAHQQLLIHRDIKPANVLLESGTGKVLLTDFGLARGADDVRLTQSGVLTGTPLYMSPEQARGESVDYRSDLFSLGSVLYTMCTGKTPFHGSTPFVVLRAASEGRHQDVRELNPKVPEEFAAIIDHLLAKSPHDRIQTASLVAEVLDHLYFQYAREKELSSRTNRSGRLASRLRPNWFRRHGAALAAVVLGINALLVVSEAARFTHWTELGQRASTGALRPFLELNAGVGPIWSVAFAPDGNSVAMGVDDGNVRIWDAHKGRLIAQFKVQEGPIWNVVFSNDGSMMATVGDDAGLRLWNPWNGQEVPTIKMPTGARSVVFSPDGRRLAIGTRGGDVRIYDIMEGTLAMPATAHKGVVMALAWSVDGQLVASASSDQTIKIWDVSGTDCKEMETLTGHTGGVYAVAFEPARNLLASGGWDHSVRLWEAGRGKATRKLDGHQDDVWAVAFCSRGRILASGGEDHTIRLWDVAAGKETKTLRGHTGTVYGLAVSPDGKTLASASRDGTVRLWEVGD